MRTRLLDGVSITSSRFSAKKELQDQQLIHDRYDNCYNDGQSGTANISFERYDVMSRALNSTGRQIVYGMCNWGQDRPFDWAYLIANSWRVSGDIYDSFDRVDPRCPCSEMQGYDCQFQGYHCSVMNIINKVVWFIHRSQPGGWNDLDMLEIGNVGVHSAPMMLLPSD